MTTRQVRTRPPLATELALRLRLLFQSGLTWAAVRLGDPFAEVMSASGRDDPYPIYERMRSTGELVRSKLGVWVSAHHHVCDEILRDRRFGVRTSEGAYGDPASAAVDRQLSLLELDPPDHSRVRKLAAPAFRPRKLAGYRQPVEDIAHELLDDAASREEFDLIQDFAAPLPIRVICQLLGLPPVNARRLAHHGVVLGGALDGIRSGKHLRHMRESTAELDAMFTELIEQRRAEPGDDIVSDLVVALEDERLTSMELIQLCDLLLVAGFETTVNLLGNGVLAMLRHPEQWELLCAKPELAGSVVEETLRWDPPVQATLRIAHEPIQVAGQDLKRDSPVITLLGAAGRDPAAHADPARFDITRTDRADHLAFSSGIHHCLGAPLARLESEIGFRALATRLPELSQAGALTRRPTSIIHGLSALPVAGGSRRAQRR